VREKLKISEQTPIKMATSNQADVFNWNSKADTAACDQWSLFLRALKVRMGKADKPIAYLMDPASSQKGGKAAKWDKVLRLAEPGNIKDGTATQVQVTLWGIKYQAREDDRLKSLEHNKRIDEVHDKGIALLQDCFKGDCHASRVLTQAFKNESTPSENYKNMWDALVAAFEPNTTVDSLKYKEKMMALTDGGIAYHEFESTLESYHAKLLLLNSLPSVSEMDQMIIMNVKNPAFLPLKTKLVLDTSMVHAATAVREYDYLHFRKDALTLANSISEVNEWGLGAGITSSLKAC
jgi:hypothetical protein